MTSKYVNPGEYDYDWKRQRGAPKEFHQETFVDRIGTCTSTRILQNGRYSWNISSALEENGGMAIITCRADPKLLIMTPEKKREYFGQAEEYKVNVTHIKRKFKGFGEDLSPNVDCIALTCNGEVFAYVFNPDSTFDPDEASPDISNQEPSTECDTIRVSKTSTYEVTIPWEELGIDSSKLADSSDAESTLKMSVNNSGINFSFSAEETPGSISLF